MPPRRPIRPVPPDIDALRSALARGKIVRVGIAPSGQFPDGVTGRVRSIGNPATDGDEYVMVEVPVGGSKDVLPFAPGDLLGAPVGRPPAATTKGTPARRSPGSPASTTGGSGDRSSPGRDNGEPDTSEEQLFPVPAPPAGAVAALASAANAPTSPDAGETVRPANKKSTGTARGKRPPVTITISTTGDESAVWRLDVRIGARAAVRPTVVPPSRVWDIVDSLGDEKASSVVKSLLDDHRRATQARADALSAQLSLLQEELRLFPGADG
jgi:hypothetical protein